MKTECRGPVYTALLLCLAAVFLLAGCSRPEKAKAEHLSKGEAYLKDEKYQEASIEFRNAIQIDDKLAAAHWGLARAYEGMQRFQEAFDELRKTADLDPNNLEAKVRLGNYYMAIAKGRPDMIAEAEKLTKDILQRDANNIEGHILMGSVLFAQNQRDKAFTELNHAIDLNPKRVESYLSLARFYIVTSDQAKAEETLKRALAVNDNSGLAHTEYGKFLVQLNRQADAEVQLKRAVEVEPSNRVSRFVLASFYLVNKQTDKAEEAFKALASLDPDKPESQAVLADFYSSVNRLDDAIRIYQDILNKTPDFTQGRYRLGEILMMKRDPQGAMAQVQAVLKKDEHDRKALLLRARLRLQSGQPDDQKAAVEDLKEILKQEPNSRMGLYYMAQVDYALGLIDQSRTFAGDLERNYPDYLPAKLLQIQINLAGGDPKTALRLANELLDRLSKATPDQDNSPQLLAEIRAKTLLARGTAQAQTGNLQAAKEDFNAAREFAPNDIEIFINLATVAKAERKADEAKGYYENALAIDATNFGALAGLIDLYTRMNASDKAHARIDQVLKSYPNNASLHYLKGQIFGVERNPQGAEAELRKTLELDPNYIAAYSALGALFINTKQEDRAIAEYKKIIELRPDNAAAYTLIGMLEDARKNVDGAIDSYRKALEKDPNAVIPANNLAWIYASNPGKGNLDEAMRLAQGAVQKNPNIAGFVDTLGWVYFKKGLYAAAVEQLQRAVSLDQAAAQKANTVPAPNYHYHLGLALKEKGDKAGAKRELEQALKLGEKVAFADANEARSALATL